MKKSRIHHGDKKGKWETIGAVDDWGRAIRETNLVQTSSAEAQVQRDREAWQKAKAALTAAAGEW